MKVRRNSVAPKLNNGSKLDLPLEKNFEDDKKSLKRQKSTGSATKVNVKDESLAVSLDRRKRGSVMIQNTSLNNLGFKN